MSARQVRDWAALSFAMGLPSLVTVTYFVLLRHQSAAVQQAAYAVGKTVQFGFPAVWVFLVLRERFVWSWPNGRGLASGVGFGALIFAAAVGLYHGVLQPRGIFDAVTVQVPNRVLAVGSSPADVGRLVSTAAPSDVPAGTIERGLVGRSPAEAIRSKLQGLGIDRLWKFVALGVFYAVFHSLLEEYYWRWFVFGRLHRLWPLLSAAGLSSLAFMAHHVILLAVYFGWCSPWTYLLSASVAVGGVVWAWLYARSGSLYGPWLSHLLVDAAIFVIGYDLARDLLS